MLLSQVKLEGFRNFRNATINLTHKSLVIGSNEIGKSNFLYALRILLDKTLSLADLEPKDSDFYIHTETNEIKILLRFENVYEECVIAKLREHVSDEGEMYLAYYATRDPDSKRMNYHFLVGRSPDTLASIESNRFYLRVLNLKFVGSKRNLFSFIRNERKNLLQDAKEDRIDDEIEQDSKTLGEIETQLDEVHTTISSLSYIGKATDSLNAELEQLSILNIGQNIIFDTGASNPSEFVDNLRLATQIGDKTLSIGGDGRNNQIHLALWAARNRPVFESDEEPLEINIFCIEEPEAHLHPHQQRKLASYLSDVLHAQVIITTHSPQIACEFPPISIIRLYDNNPDTLAAGDGSNPFIEKSFIDFGYRLNIIPAETFFSNVVFLVEGPSEVLFYKALSRQIGIDLDRLNISILMVGGVGFNVYISLLHSLNIDFVVRTDNDICKVPGGTENRFSGVQRGIKIYRTYFNKDMDFEKILADHENKLQGFDENNPPFESARQIIEFLKNFNVFLADIDLENDLMNSEISGLLADYFGDIGEDMIVDKMQKRKATVMFNFLREYSDSFQLLKGSNLIKPLLRCQEIANYYGNTQPDKRTNSSS